MNISFDYFMFLFGYVIEYMSTHGFTLTFLGIGYEFTYMKLLVGSAFVILGIELLHKIFDW